jgi:serine/threonine protein kinase
VSLAIGTKIGPYQVIGPLGQGGMGEVYRARDTRLNRDAAIKVLPAAFAQDADRVARFRREAQVLAALNHPNIAAIHGIEEADDRLALALEYVEGEDLAERLTRGALPLDEALVIARQVAEGLEAAHDKGVVHRDLKPANIKIRTDGAVKILDFGLAKAFDAEASSSASPNSPTITSPAGITVRGMILGTAAYMSPEQARGAPVDRRTDVWALGCVIYEMLTGRPAFAGASLSDIVAAVLRGEPDWRALPDETPPRIRVLLGRCLRKEARERLHDAADVRIEVSDAAADTDGPAPGPRAPTARRLAPLVLALVGGAALASALWWERVSTSRETPTPVHLTLTSVARTSSSLYLNANHQVAISPDGRNIVFVADPRGHRQLFLRSMGEADARPIDGTDDARTPFFSSDGQWIAFATTRELQKVAVSGGSPVTICALSSTGFYGGDWGSDGTIVFVPDYNGGLWRLPSIGGTPQPLLKTDPAHDRVVYADPDVLPDGKGVLFTLASGHAVTADDQDIAVLSPGAREPRVLIRGGSNARYLPTGHLVYVRAGALLSVDFDVATLTVSGTPVPVIDGLGRTWSGDADYAVSDNGTLVYEPDAGARSGRLFITVDRQGQAKPISARGNYGEFSISPDGRALATRIFAINDDIWINNVATSTLVRFTSEPLDEIYPQWTHDGARIAFGTRTGTIFWKPSDGSGAREELGRGEYARYPSSFSPDGTSMLFVEIHPSRRRDIWLMPLVGERRARPVLSTDADEWGARFSPDGRWVAYVSDETGRDEIFIRPIDSAGGRKRLSSDGGIDPMWGPDGRELFFMRGDQLAVVALDGQLNPVGRDRVLFAVPRFEEFQYDPATPDVDIMPDGEHFVFGLGTQSMSATRYNVVLNWFEELRKKLPPRADGAR